IPGTHYAAAFWRPFLRGDRGRQTDAPRHGQEQTLSSQSRIEGKVVGRTVVNPCARPLDPLDAEAIASGAEPVYARDASEHARVCPSCGQAVSDAAVLAQLFALLRAVARSLAELASAWPAGLEALGQAMRREQTLGLVCLFLLAPVLFGIRRALARERRR